MTQEFGRLLTVADVSDVLNVSIGEVSELIAAGELPAIRLSTGMWRVERDVLRSFIDGKYEEMRRAALWAETAFIDLPEFTAGRAPSIVSPQLHPRKL